MNQNQVITSARLEGVYSVMRQLQATHDGFETRCIGSGKCCKIGLVLPLAECWYIARNLRRQFWLMAEDKGIDYANVWYEGVLGNLQYAMRDKSWNPETNEQEDHCVFFQDGCTIYEFRPLVCRAYGVIAPVQDGVCPRNRLPDGGHELIRDETVERVVEEFDSLISEWGEQNPALNYSIYMPAGVLRFLLTTEELQELIAETDKKFWMGHVGYKHQLSPEHWGSETLVTLGSK